MTKRQRSTVSEEAIFGPRPRLSRRKILTGEKSTAMTTAQNITSKKGSSSQPKRSVAAASRIRKARVSKFLISLNIGASSLWGIMVNGPFFLRKALSPF